MFKEYAGGKGAGESKARYFLVIPAALALCLGFAVFAVLTGLGLGKQARDIKRQEEQARALRSSIQVGILESGFLRRTVGANDVYVPMLTVWVSNASASTIENLEVVADFVSESALSCQGNARISRLAPGEMTEASLKCIAPTGFGALVAGVPLSMTIQPVSFTIRIRCGDAYATVEQGSSPFKLLGMRPPRSLN